MDYKSFVNKESFKAILLHHLKSQIKTKFGQTITNKIQEANEEGELTSSDNVISSISKSILDSEDYPEFSTSFLKNVNDLLSDEDKYVPKENKCGNNSQCSSASSINASSIDFLSPDQFQNIISSVTSGTNVEKLEALAMLHRLPALEHLSHQFLWSDVEAGLHNSLSSDNLFLREQSLRLYVKMLSCPEPKVVQESFLSLIKYFLELLLPSLHKSENFIKTNFVAKCRGAVQIISILNKFLQSISTHWLRYPQLLIEGIVVQSLSILAIDTKEGHNFPVWMCIALCDSEARWLKNIMHGHVSRAALLNALEKNLNILQYAIDYCDKFCSDDNGMGLQDSCCEKPHFMAETTHVICFLSHLLQYCDGRKVFCSIVDGKISGCWMNAMDVVMQCVHKLCSISCFNCCVLVCDMVAKKWHYIWNANDASVQKDHLIQLLFHPVINKECLIINNLYFTIQCLCEIIDSCNDNLLSELGIDNLIQTILMNCVELEDNFDLSHFCTSVVHLYNSSLKLVKHILLAPSTLFLNSDFNTLLVKWCLKIHSFSANKTLANNKDIVTKQGMRIVSDLDKNISNVFVQLLRKPISIMLSLETPLYEISLNVLLEKILKDIKANGSICPCDTSTLSHALSRDVVLRSVLNKTNTFRISSIIWLLKERNEMEDIESFKYVLEKILPSFCYDLLTSEMSVNNNLSPEINLYHHMLLFPNKINELISQEEYVILSLQIISLLSCSIQSLCLLQSKFKVSQLLLELQHSYVSVDENHVIDPISILINHILVKQFAIGGPGERILPCESLEMGDFEYDWPFVKEFPISNVFYQLLVEHNHAVIDVNVGLEDIFLNYIHLRKPASDFVYHLVKNCINCIHATLQYPEILPDVGLDDSNHVLHDEEMEGILLVRRYEKYLNLNPTGDDGQLEQLLKASKCFLNAMNSASLDVFVCTIYLMCKGDIEIAFVFLKKFAKSCYSFFIWREHLVQASEKCPKFLILHNVILELCDLIVKRTFPSFFSIFQFHGTLPSVVYSYWTKQCYWNFLDFDEISHFVLLIILFSGEFSLYFFVAILKHLHFFILKRAHSKDLISELFKSPIKDFKLCDYIDFMIELKNEFQDLISKTLSQTLKDNKV